MAADSSSSSSNTAVVAIVVLVLICLGAIVYFLNRGGADQLVPDKVQIDVNDKGGQKGSGTPQ